MTIATGGRSPGGTFSDHDLVQLRSVRVAPTLAAGKQLNTLRFMPAPLACWRLEDLRFDFDSSFVLADAEAELALLATAFVRLGAPSLSVFGHADPVGDDEYNKTLSGRRAQAVYAMLVRDADLWEDLFTHPFGGDDWRSGGAIDKMRARLGDGGSGLTPIPAARKALFLAYMDAVCRDGAGTPFSVPKTGFLGRGLMPAARRTFRVVARSTRSASLPPPRARTSSGRAATPNATGATP